MKATAASMLAFVTLVFPPALAGPSPQSEIWSRPVSPAVVATFINQGGRPRAILLWRGKPLWFVSNGKHISGGGGPNGTVSGVLDYGAIRIEYELTQTSAEIQGVRLPLAGDENLFLVDSVDNPRAQQRVTAHVVQWPHIEISTPLGPVFRSVPDAFTFLRCGESPQDSVSKVFNQVACDDPGAQ